MPPGNQFHVPIHFSFIWSPTGFAYFGTFVTPEFYQMFKVSFIFLDLERWNSLPKMTFSVFCFKDKWIFYLGQTKTSHKDVKVATPK